ncbi:PAS domain-containing sensor histidine kinase [Mucilaginibacter flavidus]|uniref:PAS domain-containing sensor histidine kinase n=1 Tax=Mucilaginibacter flavidus TaxID=2949309 RepID=UPI00209241DB|nr:PAS domain-containing sensor histidine kinase [Mucilaginibacter flavidus]MCO5951069.1 PAS domain-containing sensor histidine kinase [Mucilaginibacter flavidus]
MSADLLPFLPDDIFKIVFEKSPGSLLVKGDAPRFTIVAVSDTYLDVTSSTREAIVGKGFFEAFPEDKTLSDDTNARVIFTRVVNTRQKIDVPAYRFDVFNPDTKTHIKRHWSCCNTPIFDNEGSVTYILNTVVDITEEVRAREASTENENRLLLATEAAAMATWDLGLLDNSFVCSPRLAEIFGFSADTTVVRENLQTQIDADDMKNIVVPAYHKALLTGTYVYEVKIHLPDDSLRWIKTQGIVVYDDKKQPVRMLGTVIDITDTKRDEIRKNDFIAMASHELKTPLTSIKAYIQILAKRLIPLNDSFVNTTLMKAGNQVTKMTDLIHSFLDLSRLESGKLQMKLVEFDMNELVEETIAETQLLSPGHPIEFEPGRQLFVKADAEKIGQVIGNLLSNALKYSDKDSTITVTCTSENNNVKVLVTDKGIGINAKDQEKLFQRFYRVESDKMKNISGFGIGLYLSSEIIQRHKGTIGVQSEEGRGATFYFTLPAATGI